VELNDSIRPPNVTIYRGGTPKGGRRLGRNPRRWRSCCIGQQEGWPMGWAYLTQDWLRRNLRRWRPCCLGQQEGWPMGWAYLTQEEAQRTMEPNALTGRSL
jgi:hypothetical protein